MGVVIGILTCPSPKGEGILILSTAPSAFGTSPKYDNGIYTIFGTLFIVVFGGGRVGAGFVPVKIIFELGECPHPD